MTGLGVPLVYDIFAPWVPAKERATLLSMVFNGGCIANIVNYPFTSLMCQTEIGWPLAFYIPGKL